jgi:hypothetical protein
MSSLPASLVAVFVCLLLTGCKQTPAVDIRAEADSLRSIETQWAEANKAKDFDRIVSFAAPNIVLMNANQPLAAGREALRRAVEEAEKWVTIYKKIDGKWKAILDIYNSDKPATSF